MTGTTPIIVKLPMNEQLPVVPRAPHVFGVPLGMGRVLRTKENDMIISERDMPIINR